MKQRTKKGTRLIGILVVLAMLPGTGLWNAAAETEQNIAESIETPLRKTVTYSDYLQAHEEIPNGTDEIVIAADSYERTNGEYPSFQDHQGMPGISVEFPANGSVSFRFTVQEAGMYSLFFTYYTGSESGSSAVRDILIDGTLPFEESAEVSFSQRWVNEDGDEIVLDSQGNQIRSKQVQQQAWAEEYAADPTGYYAGALKYYLSEGEHVLTLDARRECLLLHHITVCQDDTVPSYDVVLEQYQANGFQNATPAADETYEAENAAAKSDQTMYPLADRTSPTVSPYSASAVRYNTVGGAQWKLAGQWIEWKVFARESGLYQIVCHFKQDEKVNDVSIREVTIDGHLPFEEAASISFYYDGAWQRSALSDKDGVPYLFYLDQGEHTIRFRVGLGDTAASINLASELLQQLNSVYRRIVVITGSSPDQYRDYQLDELIPDVLEEMKTLSGNLRELEKAVIADNQSGGQSTAAIKRIYLQLDQMTEDSDKVALLLSSFQENISSFGTWINSRIEQPLELDTISILSPDTELEKGEAGFFGLLKHYIVQFFYSFLTDYASIGVVDMEMNESIKVWLASGRDQSQILKQMINDSFTPDNSIAVDLQLVTASALLPSVIAGTAPDVYMGMAQTDPVNLAMRDALTDLSQCDGFDEITQRFYEEALVPFEFQGGTYALPDTMSYYMLFYRTDLLEELGISVDQLDTWDSILKDVLPELQINSLSFGMPVGINSFLTFYYQRGGELYYDGGRKSSLSNATALEAMERFSQLYTQYGLPLSYDFANRFRSGEMPIAVADYLSYNQLTVFAPEIKGQWSMLPVPGTVQEDGSIDHSTVATVTGSVILAKSEHVDASWEYLKWWSSRDVQQEYGSNLESVVGAAARYNSANIEAMNLVQWDYDIKDSLNRQLEWIKAYPEVPGGYLTTRYYDFAFRDIVYSDKKVRETMIDAVEHIDSEIAHKREEYNLD